VNPRKRAATPGAVEQPSLAQSLTILAKALDRRNDGTEDAPTYLDIAVMVAGIETELDDLARLLVHLARRHEGTSWQDIGDAMGVTRQTAYKRWGTPSPNDPEAEGDEA
jgi:CRP-like cAMP-binding protein